MSAILAATIFAPRRRRCSLDSAPLVGNWPGGINEMPNLERLRREFCYLFLELSIGHRESIMLALMLPPGIHQKAFQIMLRMLGIEEDAPASGTVAPADALILVDRIEELRSILGIDGVFHGNHDRSLFRLGLNKHGRFAPMIPVSQIE